MSHWLQTPLGHDAGLIVLALALSAMIGWEREMQDRPAGLRTHMLVCLGATLITLVDHMTPGSSSRITAQIVTGVGFLGAGTIIRQGDGASIRGLTTAASIWTVAAMGIAIGSGGIGPMLAVICTVVALFVLSVVNRLEWRLDAARHYQHLTVMLARQDVPAIAEVLQEIKGRTGGIRRLDVQDFEGGKVLRLVVEFDKRDQRDALSSYLSDWDHVLYYDWYG